LSNLVIKYIVGEVEVLMITQTRVITSDDESMHFQVQIYDEGERYYAIAIRTLGGSNLRGPKRTPLFHSQADLDNFLSDRLEEWYDE
jgi:hypothetical protein